MDAAALSSRLPDHLASRVSALVLRDGAATVVLDAGGLSADARAAFEAEVERILRTDPEVAEVRIATSAERHRPRLLAVGSGKGGVGKSTLAANLAIALARLGRRVGLVDADIYGPSQPTIMGTAGITPEARDNKPVPVPSAFGVPLLSMGQLVAPGRALAWRGPMAGNALAQLVEAHWDDTDLLIVDLPPGTGDVQLTMLQRFKPVGAVLVSTPQDLALIDAARAGQLFDQAGVPIVGLVENMAGYACPHCGELSDPFGQGGVEAAAQRLDLPFLGRIPLSLAIREGGDAARPAAAGDDDLAAPFHAIAAAVSTWLDANASA